MFVESITKKTTPIQDVWMFLWRFLFTPLVIALSFVVPILINACWLALFIIIELIAIVTAFFVSLFSRHWLFSSWIKGVYRWFWDIDEGAFNTAMSLPSTAWKTITAPKVHQKLCLAVAWCSLVLWFVANFVLLLVWVTHYHHEATWLIVLWAYFGLPFCWGVLALLKFGLEAIFRWVFRVPRLRPATSTSHGTEVLSDSPR